MRFLRKLDAASILALGISLVGIATPLRSCARPAQSQLPSPSWRIDLNAATTCELQLIPGIGPGRAAAILRYRSKEGSFRNWKDLEMVEGIGPWLLQKIRQGPVLPLEGH